MNSIERRLLRLEQQYRQPRGLEDFTDLELMDTLIAVNQLVADSDDTAEAERQKIIDEMPQLLDERARTEWYSRYDGRPSRPVSVLLAILFPDCQPPGGERAAA